MVRRRSLSPKQRRDMLADQGGICAKCPAPIGPQPDGIIVPFIGEHSVTVESGNDQKPDCLLCVPCAKRKTFGTKATSYGSDAHERAKVKRLRGETKNGPKRRLPSRPMPVPPPGFSTRWPSQCIPSRPWQKRGERNG